MNSNAANFEDSGIALDASGDCVLKALSVPITAATLNGTSEVELESTLPADSVVTEVYLLVNTPEATAVTKTLDIGTLSTSAGDADGFLDGVDVSTSGLKKGSLASTGQTLGALLRADESGAGALVPEPYVNTAEKALSVTAGSVGFADLDAKLIVVYKEITD